MVCQIFVYDRYDGRIYIGVGHMCIIFIHCSSGSTFSQNHGTNDTPPSTPAAGQIPQHALIWSSRRRTESRSVFFCCLLNSIVRHFTLGLSLAILFWMATLCYAVIANTSAGGDWSCPSMLKYSSTDLRMCVYTLGCVHQYLYST